MGHRLAALALACLLIATLQAADTPRPETTSTDTPEQILAPAISSISPSSAPAGGPAFTLTVNGSEFTPLSVVRWNGADRSTAFVSLSQLTASIPATDIASPGTASVTVATPILGTSNAVTFTITASNPVPSISGLNPASASAQGPGFNLTVLGSSFVSGSVVLWNGGNRATSFVSATQLTAAILAADIASTGVASVTVFNPAPGGGTSNALSFTITVPVNPVPNITAINPTSAQAGAPAFNLTVNGANFIAGSVVRWNGADRATAFVSETRLTASIPASDVASAGSASVTVFNPSPGGGTSNAASFTITPVNPAPAISSISPTSAVAGGNAFVLTVSGSGFIPASVVRWNGVSRSTAFVSATQLTASIQKSDISSAGSAA
ncbi:MAG: hypothetical protein DMG07_00560, partial [Acidobacteria bacterium]